MAAARVFPRFAGRSPLRTAQGASIALVLSACGNPAPTHVAARSDPPHAASDAGGDGGAPSEPESIESVVARGNEELPSMRLVVRTANVTGSVDVALATDGCLRARIASTVPVEAWFEDASKARRAEVSRAIAVVPPRGPVCARKGETLRLVILRPAAHVIVRAAVWQSP